MERETLGSSSTVRMDTRGVVGELSGASVTSATVATATDTSRPVAALSAERDQLGDLNGVERGALAQVVAGHEQGKAATVGPRAVLPDPADEGRIRPGRLQRVRHVGQLHPRSTGEQ